MATFWLFVKEGLTVVGILVNYNFSIGLRKTDKIDSFRETVIEDSHRRMLAIHELLIFKSYKKAVVKKMQTAFYEILKFNPPIPTSTLHHH